MKKYVKPDFYYENFQLSNYASGCSVVADSTNASDAATCSATLPGGITVFASAQACITPTDIFCSQNGGEGYIVMWS